MGLSLHDESGLQKSERLQSEEIYKAKRTQKIYDFFSGLIKKNPEFFELINIKECILVNDEMYSKIAWNHVPDVIDVKVFLSSSNFENIISFSVVFALDSDKRWDCRFPANDKPLLKDGLIEMYNKVDKYTKDFMEHISEFIAECKGKNPENLYLSNIESYLKQVNNYKFIQEGSRLIFVAELETLKKANLEAVNVASKRNLKIREEQLEKDRLRKEYGLACTEYDKALTAKYYKPWQYRIIRYVPTDFNITIEFDTDEETDRPLIDINDMMITKKVMMDMDGEYYVALAPDKKTPDRIKVTAKLLDETIVTVENPWDSLNKGHRLDNRFNVRLNPFTDPSTVDISDAPQAPKI